MTIRFKLTLVACVLAAASSAQATSFASASLGPIQIQLFDLNPLDNVAASITFTSATASNYGYTYANNGAEWGYLPYLSGTGTVSAGTSNTSISTTFTAGNTSSLQGATVSASSQASGSATGGQGYYYNYINAPNYNAFTVSANTLVVFSALATTSAQTTVGYDSINYRNETASASASLNITGPGPLGATGSQSSSDSLYSYAYVTYQTVYDPVSGNYSYQYSGQQDVKSQVLSASFVNLSGAEKTGTINVQAYNYGYSGIAAAVPEPETYALMLAGLGLMGAVARRRRARAA